MSQRIEDYALIGDTQTAALVGKDGSIDWLCLPRFDSGARASPRCSGRATTAAGCSRRPAAIQRVERRYRDDTLVLETEFDTDDGDGPVIDCMPIRRRTVDIVRIVEGVSGRVPIAHGPRGALRLRQRSCPWVRRPRRATCTRSPGPTRWCCARRSRRAAPGTSTVADFVVEAGEPVPFVLAWYPSHERAAARRGDAHTPSSDTEAWWRHWSTQCTYDGEWPRRRHAVAASR